MSNPFGKIRTRRATLRLSRRIGTLSLVTLCVLGTGGIHGIAAVHAGGGDWSVSLDADNYSPNNGDTVSLTAYTNRDVGPSPYYIEIVDQTTGITVNTCGTGTSCQADVSNWDETDTYVAQIDDQAQSDPVTITWPTDAGSGSASSPALSVDQSELDWHSKDGGPVRSGTQNGDIPVTVTNTGDAPLEIYGININGKQNPDYFSHAQADPSPFSVANDSCSGVTLAPGDTCSITPVFTVPDTSGCEGEWYAEIDFDSNAQSSDTVTLDGSVPYAGGGDCPLYTNI
jgi:hypothetical protein